MATATSSKGWGAQSEALRTPRGLQTLVLGDGRVERVRGGSVFGREDIERRGLLAQRERVCGGGRLEPFLQTLLDLVVDALVLGFLVLGGDALAELLVVGVLEREDAPGLSGDRTSELRVGGHLVHVERLAKQVLMACALRHHEARDRDDVAARFVHRLVGDAPDVVAGEDARGGGVAGCGGGTGLALAVRALGGGARRGGVQLLGAVERRLIVDVPPIEAGGVPGERLLLLSELLPDP